MARPTNQCNLSLQGKHFGEWVVLGKGAPSREWLCQCSCGRTFGIIGAQLTLGKSTRCKHCANLSHGKSSSRAYQTWAGMISRCKYPSHPGYHNYGGRGIEVCDSWRIFENFYRDMGDPPKGKSLDRIDVNGNYCKNNCRWVSKAAQCVNVRKSKRNTSGTTGVSWDKKRSKWAAYISVESQTIRLGHHESLEAAIATRFLAEAMYYRPRFRAEEV